MRQLLSPGVIVSVNPHDPPPPSPVPDNPRGTPARPLPLPSLQPTLVFSGADLKAATESPSNATQVDLDAPAFASATIDLDAPEHAAGVIALDAPAFVPGTVVLSPEELARFRVAEDAPRSGAGTNARSNATLVLSPEELARFRPAGVTEQRTLSAPPRSGRPPLALFGALALAVLALAGLGGTRLLIATNRAWIAPTVLSKSDPRTLQVATTLEQEMARASELASRREQALARRDDLERTIALEASFRSSFEAAVRSDLQRQRDEVRRLQKLVDAPDVTGSDARRVELDAMLTSARRRIRLLEGALANGRPNAYDALALRREYDLSRMASDKATAEKAALAGTLAEIDQALRQNASLLAKIEGSPYRLAIEHDVTLGFLPNENAEEVRIGQPLVACRLGTLVCTRVGVVDAVLDGEVRGTNPITRDEQRGQLVKLTLTTPEAATTPMLFSKSTP